MNRSEWLLAAASAGAARMLNGCASTAEVRNGAATPTDTIEIGRIQWEVRKGLTIPLRAYGGVVPGRTLRYKLGEQAHIRVVNRSGEPQVIHWHGLIVSDKVDGTPELGTPLVASGRSLDYAFTVTPAGSRWYHSHAGEGLFSGMYGPLIVDDPNEPGQYDREVILMIGAFGPLIPRVSMMRDQRPPGSPGLTEPVMDMAPRSAGMSGMNVTSGGATDSMSLPNMGMRDATYQAYGINGKALHAGDPIRVRRGERIRFRIYNASATKTVRLALPGHRFQVTHLDGYRVPKSRTLDAVELGVAERIDTIVTMDNPGNWIFGSTVDAERIAGLGVVVAYEGARGVPEWRSAPSTPFRYTDFGRPSTVVERNGAIDLVLRKSSAAPGAWSINRAVYPHGTPIDVIAGRDYRIRFVNMSMMEHPMHLHGHGFELRAVDGVPTAGVTKDTVTVRPMGGTIDVLVRTDNPYGGSFLLHCHNEQHMKGGMATVLRYQRP